MNYDIFLNIINRIVDEGDTVPFFLTLVITLSILVCICMYFLYDALSYKVLFKQMTLYRDRIKPIIDNVKRRYAEDLMVQYEEGLLMITSSEIGNILARHSDLIDTCFIAPERYFRNRLLENHVAKKPNYRDKKDKYDKELLCFENYCRVVFMSHNAECFDVYKQRYCMKFFPLDIFDRIKSFENVQERFFEQFKMLIADCSEISRKRWFLK